MANPPEALLQMDSKDAVYAMGQEVLDVERPGHNVRWYNISPPAIDEAGMCQVVFTLEKILTPVENWDALRDFTITYPLINIADIIPQGVNIIGLLPSDSIQCMRSALSPFNIPVRDEEFTKSIVTTEGPLPIFTERGYRWIGETQLLFVKKQLTIAQLIEHHAIVTNFSPDYSSLNIRDDIIAHLNRFNVNRLPRSLNKGDVRFCLPVVNGSISDKLNTQVRLVATGGDYVGDGNVYYKRRDYESTWRLPIEMEKGSATTIYQLLPSLSAIIKCTITQTDVADGPLDGDEVVIHFSPSSMGYVGFIKVRFI